MDAITLTEQVSTELQQRINAGFLAVGSQLPTGKSLAAEFGVSNAVIREAVARLQSLGMVETRQGSRTVIISSTPDNGFSIPVYNQYEAQDFADLYELRLDIEVAAASHAASRRTTADLDRLEDCLAKMAVSLEGEANGVSADMTFHLTIAAATQNPHYANLIQYLNSSLHKTIATARQNSARHPQLPKHAQREHEDIFTAIKEQNPKAASHAMASHIHNAASRLLLPHR